MHPVTSETNFTTPDCTARCSEIGSLWSLDAPELHASVTSENQFHCTRLYILGTTKTLLGRLRERAKRDESDSGDGSGNVCGAGLDPTGSGHSSRRVRGLWLARPIESDSCKILTIFFFFWQRRTLDSANFGQRGRTLPLSTARNLDFGQRGLCHGVDFFSRNEWQQLFCKWAINPDHYSVFLLFQFPFEENHQIKITVNPENVNKTRLSYDHYHDLDSADLQLHVVCLWIREGVTAPFFWCHTRLRLVTSGLTSFLLVTSASRVTLVWLLLVSFRVFS